MFVWGKQIDVFNIVQRSQASPLNEVWTPVDTRRYYDLDDCESDLYQRINE